MISAPNTAGKSHIPAMRADEGGKAMKRKSSTWWALFQAQKMTPEETAMTAATTMSTTRQLEFLGVVLLWPRPVMVTIVMILLGFKEGRETHDAHP